MHIKQGAFQSNEMSLLLSETMKVVQNKKEKENRRNNQ